MAAELGQTQTGRSLANGLKLAVLKPPGSQSLSTSTTIGVWLKTAGLVMPSRGRSRRALASVLPGVATLATLPVLVEGWTRSPVTSFVRPHRAPCVGLRCVILACLQTLRWVHTRDLH